MLAARLLASSSSCCFFACACRSLHVSLPGARLEGAGGGGADLASSSNLANGFLSFLGAGRCTGVYAVPTGAMRSSGSGFVGAVAEATGGGERGAAGGD